MPGGGSARHLPFVQGNKLADLRRQQISDKLTGFP
jgi:hypothetical protein